MAHIPLICRDSSQQQMNVKDPAIVYFQHCLANVVINLDPHICRGLPTWKERQEKGANLLKGLKLPF
jgi:hypothetical protein